jgi:malate dehydrogenase
MTAMSMVAIVGAGEIGAATARVLAARSKVTVVRLIDEHGDVAIGKALDLRQTAPVINSDTMVEASRDYSAAAGAVAIVLADSAREPGAEWAGEAGLALLARLNRMAVLEQSVLICAGATQQPLMQQALDELGIARLRLIGSAPEAFAATARALVAIDAQASAAQVMLTVIGVPPRRFVIPWTDSSIAGTAVASMLAPTQLHRLETRLRGLWPPGPAALGTAAALMAEAVAVGSRRLFSTFVSLDRDNGTKAPVCAWPVSIGASGVERIASPVFTGRDRVVIDEVLE